MNSKQKKKRLHFRKDSSSTKEPLIKQFIKRMSKGESERKDKKEMKDRRKLSLGKRKKRKLPPKFYKEDK